MLDIFIKLMRNNKGIRFVSNQINKTSLLINNKKQQQTINKHSVNSHKKSNKNLKNWNNNQ